MCGICGFVKFDIPLNGEDSGIIERMNKRLMHRGPDAQTTLLLENVALGFNRLSIIGLDNGMQPIFSEDESLVLICNGEIFDHIEQRDRLKKRGHIFRSNSDVEVILHLYEDHGMDFLNRINGQFAFALYDRKKKTLFCARDQMGIIPFYYTVVKNMFIFASEIKAILEHPLVEREVDLVGLDQVFTFAGLISPRTMFRNIHSLENGHFLSFDGDGEIKNTEYWDLIYPEECEEQIQPEDFYINRLEELFDASIRYRLRAEVPSGFYLSGGLDSSLIAMKLFQLSPGQNRDAFSIDFVDSGISETIYQKMVADKSGSHLNKHTFFSNDISSRLQKAIYHCECPLKETYNTASLALSESVRKKGVKVILSGEGADELFAGYIGYRFDQMRATNQVQNPATRKEGMMREKVWGDKDFFYETDFSELEGIKKGLYSEELNEVFDSVDCLNHAVVNKERLANKSLLNRRSYIDFKTRLVDHLVSDHGDKMALANSVEVRYPFLDKDLVEFSTRIPSRLKLKDLSEKYIIKKIAARCVPKAVIDREKFGFVAPGSPYLLQHNIEYINDLLSHALIKEQGFFDADQVEKLKCTYKQRGFSLNVPYERDLLIVILTFGILLDNYFD